jgi:hypothetical protein
MARYRSRGRSRSGGRRRSGGGRKRGSGGRYVSSGGGGGGGGGGGSRGGSISGKTLAMIAGGAVVAFVLYKKFGGVHPAVHAAAMAQQPGAIPGQQAPLTAAQALTANQLIDQFAAQGGETDFNSSTNIGLPIPYNPGPGMQSGPLQL